MNIHPFDLTDDDRYEPTSPLARIAASVVLAITERTPLDHVRDLVSRVKELRALGVRIAGLTAFSQLEPEIAKIDMSLVRGIDSEPRKKRVVRSMVELCKDLGASIIAEGVETTGERDTLADQGCDLLQGYLYARPEQGFVEPEWYVEPRARDAQDLALAPGRFAGARGGIAS